MRASKHDMSCSVRSIRIILLRVFIDALALQCCFIPVPLLEAPVLANDVTCQLEIEPSHFGFDVIVLLQSQLPLMNPFLESEMPSPLTLEFKSVQNGTVVLIELEMSDKEQIPPEHAWRHPGGSVVWFGRRLHIHVNDGKSQRQDVRTVNLSPGDYRVRAGFSNRLLPFPIDRETHREQAKAYWNWPITRAPSIWSNVVSVTVPQQWDAEVESIHEATTPQFRLTLSVKSLERSPEPMEFSVGGSIRVFLRVENVSGSSVTILNTHLNPAISCRAARVQLKDSTERLSEDLFFQETISNFDGPTRDGFRLPPNGILILSEQIRLDAVRRPSGQRNEIQPGRYRLIADLQQSLITPWEPFRTPCATDSVAQDSMDIILKE